MYNRYVPTADGCYQRQIMRSAKEPPAVPPRQEAPKKEENTVCEKTAAAPLPIKLESEDLLVLLILALVLMSGQESDNLPILITIAAFILLR